MRGTARFDLQINFTGTGTHYIWVRAADGKGVTLTTSEQPEGVEFTVTVNGVQDVCAAGNAVSGQQATFTTIILLTKTETFDTEQSAMDNGWVEVRSRNGKNDFGFSNTDNNGAGAGEAGGLVPRAEAGDLRLEIAQQPDGMIQVTFPGGVLETATSVVGPWENSAQQTSPATFPTDDTQRSFRLRGDSQ